jgi:hypothetical protein
MVSQSSDDTPTGPIEGQFQQPPQPRISRAQTTTQSRTGDWSRRWNIISDLTAIALLVLALFLPWNLYFGVEIPDSKPMVFAVLLAVTLLSLVAVAVAGSWRSAGARFNPAKAGRLRLGFNVPYLLLVLAFVGFDIVQTVRFGGTVNVPGGVGPGAWVGVAGSLLSAQMAVTGAHTGPVPEDDELTGWYRSVRIIGYASMLAAVLSFGFNLYWRVRYALQSAGGAAEFGKQNIAVIATSVVYGVVALIAVLVASRWLSRNTKAFRLAAVALGGSTLIAGILVWSLPIGRDVDAFHGIAQNTSTAGVGFEGYLAWAAAAAIFAPRVLFGHRNTAATEENTWRIAARNGLLLMAVWCVGSMAMRITDLLVSVSLNYPFSKYDSVMLAAFDLTTAVLAIWLRVNLANYARSARLISSLCGLVATLSVGRVIVGVALAPRFAESPNSPALQPVYGNNLAQQITSTFDVTLCGVGLSIFAAAIITGHLSGRRLRRQARRVARQRAVPAGGARPGPDGPPARVRVGQTAAPSAAETSRIRTGPPQPVPSPRIFRGDDSATRQIPVHRPQIFRPPQA